MSLSAPHPSFFIPFEEPVDSGLLPAHFTFLVDDVPHPLCTLACTKLQTYLETQDEWEHNFGLAPNKEGAIIGKMFGVLVVKTQKGELGYLAAFSGKLAGRNDHTRFVPAVFDALTGHTFLNEGMQALNHINQKIAELEAGTGFEEKISQLKNARKSHSVDLQGQLFDQYHFLNIKGITKSLRELFAAASYKNPPSGAGECAAPKLLQYAFQHQMKPLAIAEFWWGQSPKSAYWQHGHFYNPCKEKCAPILAHMLSGIDEDRCN